MTFKQQKQKIKEELKSIASDIRVGKFLRKPRRFEKANAKDQKRAYNLVGNQDTFRHMHIAYCMFFNRTPIEEIEKTKKYRSSYTIDKYMKEWKEKIEDYREDVRDCAA